MKSIGIDLGTTNTVACTIVNGRYKFLQFHHKELLPSVILYKDGKVTVGESAKKKAKIYAENYISSAKTYMGDDDKVWRIEDRTFTPVDVAAEVLGEIYKEAQRLFGKEEIQAVVTTPAYFSGKQNAATAAAGKKAGFIVKQVLVEPVAAALAYSSENLKSSEKVYVVDLGGGTFDVTLLEVVSQNEFRTLMKDGDCHLGGDDFDKVIEEIMQSRIRQDIGVDLSSAEESGLSPEAYGRAKQKLLQEAERVKCSLSEAETEDVSIVNLFPYHDGNYDFTTEITRDEFINESYKLIRYIKNVISRSLKNSRYSVADIDRVILVGGSSNMPFIREYVESFFAQKPYADKDLSKLVAMGAAIRADNDRGDTITLHDIIAHSLGIAIIDNQYKKLLEKDMEYPCKVAKIFTTTYDYQKAVDIEVYEGENTQAADTNTYYGGFTVNNIQRAKEGIPQIEVTFEFDESCILHVSARDLATGAFGSKNININTRGKY